MKRKEADKNLRQWIGKLSARRFWHVFRQTRRAILIDHGAEFLDENSEGT